MTYTFIPTEELDDDYDCGVMPSQLQTIGSEVVGHRIVKVEKREEDRGV